MEEEVQRIREVQFAKRRRRWVAGGLAALIVLPFVVVLLYARATAIHLAALEAAGEKIYHEGFEYLIVTFYIPFAVVGLIWSLAIFVSPDHWPKSKLFWQSAVIFFIAGIPAVVISAIFIVSMP